MPHMKRVATKTSKVEEMYIVPESDAPEHCVANDDGGDVTWKFTRTTTMHPFWAIRRMTKSEAAQAQAAADVARQKKQQRGTLVDPTPTVSTNRKFISHSVTTACHTSIACMCDVL